jgi:hypothetical protein
MEMIKQVKTPKAPAARCVLTLLHFGIFWKHDPHRDCLMSPYIPDATSSDSSTSRREKSVDMGRGEPEQGEGE